MSKLMIALFAAGLSFAGASVAQVYAPKTDSTPTSRDNYTAAKWDAGAQYKIDQDTCSLLDGNAEDVCGMRAKGKQGVAKADAKSAYEGTPISFADFCRMPSAFADAGTQIVPVPRSCPSSVTAFFSQ